MMKTVVMEEDQRRDAENAEVSAEKTLRCGTGILAYRRPVRGFLEVRTHRCSLRLSPRSLRLCVAKASLVLLKIQALLSDLIDLALRAQCQIRDRQT
jgi:hypothetical protein